MAQRILPGRPTTGKQAGKGKTNPKQPIGPPPPKLKATAKAKPRGPAGQQQCADEWGGDYGRPTHPVYYGSASRRRAMTLLGQESWQDMAAWGLKRDVRVPPPPPMNGIGKNKAKRQVVEEPNEPEEIPELEVPPLMRVEIPDDVPPVADAGLPTEAPIVHWSKALCATSLWSNTSTILSELVEDVAADVQLNDDCEWELYPQLGEAIKDNGGDESSLCVAICSSKECWGVGVCGKKKNRETAAKLALCVALASAAEQDFASKWIDFMEFALSGTMPPLKSQEDEAWAEAAAAKKRKKNNEAADDVEKPKKKVAESWVEKTPLPRDVPLWVTLPAEEDRPAQLAELANDQCLVVSTAGGKKGLYSQSDQALRLLVPDLETDVEFHDDPNWTAFPAIGKALKAIAEQEECFTVAVCPSLDIWAVGVAMKSKLRQAAAKAAIAASIALQKQEADELPEEFEEFNSLQEFLEEAREAKEQEL